MMRAVVTTAIYFVLCLIFSRTLGIAEKLASDQYDDDGDLINEEEVRSEGKTTRAPKVSPGVTLTADLDGVGPVKANLGWLFATTTTAPDTTSTAITASTTSITTTDSPTITVPVTTSTKETTATTSATTTTTASTTVAAPKACSGEAGMVQLGGNTIAGSVSWASPSKDSSAFNYYGIKYALANRFEVSTLNSNYTRFLGEPVAGYRCPQRDEPLSRTSEDCLYLDIYSPPVVRSSTDLPCPAFPVMLFVHGGAYRAGSKDAYPSTNLSNSIQAIVVIPNYRLGIFGFLSTQDDKASGNWGLYDLNLALKWTKENIRFFGGDDTKITIVGQSTGAALVSLMMLNSENRARVHGAFAMSGSSLAPWALVRNPKSTTYQLSNILHCPNRTSTVVVECLKSKSIAELLDAMVIRNLAASKFASPVVMGPVIDGLLIPDEPEKLLGRATWTLEGGFTNGFMAHDASVLLASDQIWKDKLSSTNFSSVTWFEPFYYPEAVQNLLGCKPSSVTIVKQIYDFYALPQIHSSAETREKLVQIATEMLFVVPAMKEAAFYANRNLTTKPNIMYNISYTEKAIYDKLVNYVPGSAIGAFHSLDLAYLFGDSIMNDILGIRQNNIREMRSLETVSFQMRNMVNNVINLGYAGSSQYSFKNGVYMSLESPAGWVAHSINLNGLVQFWDTISACK